MIEILIALVAALAGFLLTRTYYVKKISKLEIHHQVKLNADFHKTFEAGYKSGFEYGWRKGFGKESYPGTEPKK